MPLINTSLPNLIQGVSQQPDALRYDGQCEEQENALSSVVDGLVKRPNTRHVARLLEEAISADSFIHFIDRTDAEKYVVIHDGTKIRTFNLGDGTEGSIDGSTGGYTPSVGDYLYSTNPREDLKALTIGDSTFIVNTTKTVEESSSTTTEFDKAYAMMFVNQGDYSKRYNITITGTSPVTISPNYSASTSSQSLDGVSVDFLYAEEGYPSDFESGFESVTFTSSDTASGVRSVDSFTIDTNEDDTFRSTVSGGLGPAKIILIRTIKDTGQSFVSDIYEFYDVTDAYDITYNDTAERITSITAKATGSSVPLKYLEDVLQGSTLDDGGENLTADVTEYLVFRTEPSLAVSTGTTVKRVVQSGDSQSASNADTTVIAGNLVFGGSRVVANDDTYGSDDEYGSLYRFESLDASGFPVSAIGKETSHTFFLRNLNDEEMTITVGDGLSGSGLKLVYKESDALSSLPLQAKNRYAVKIIGDAELSQDDYYVEFITNTNQQFGNGTWRERAGFNISQGIDDSTMPHRLINSAENVFSLSTINTVQRKAGDDASNPHPSFVGNKISNLFLYKNRLGFLSNENVIMSAAGDLFNFYRKTVTTLLDDAPIDVSVASGRVLDLEDAVGFQENLILFGDNGQFVLKGGDLLTPKTISVTPITSYDYDGAVNPLALGSYIYFPFSRGSFTGLREFSTSATTDTYDSVEVSDHVPRYVPSNLIDMAGTTSEDIIALLSGDEPNALYVYNYFWNGNQKLLSAWSKFTFKGDIRGLQFIDSTLYLVTVHNGETNLEALPLESGLKDPVGYNTYLDQRIEATVLNGNDTITLPYTPASSDEIQVYTKDGLKLSSSRIGSTVTLTQAVSEDTDVWVGYPYEMRYTFSELLFKAAAGNSKSPSNAAKLKVRNGSLFYNDSAYFKVSVTPLYRDTYENVFTPDVVGSTTLGELNLDSGAYRFPVFSNAEDTKITITNDSALPSNITSAEFESFVHSRSNRYAG